MDQIQHIIEYIGFWNLFSILTFLFGTIYTAYTFFKSFFRMVYSSQKTCKNCDSKNEWMSEGQSFVSRVIFFNNGRKTLTKNELNKIQIFSSGITLVKIKSEDNEIVSKVSSDKKTLEIEFNQLDASNYIVVQLSHKGHIIVKGRVAESGRLLHTEPKEWKLVNFILVLYCFASMFLLVSIDNKEAYLLERIVINLALILLLNQLFRYIHKLFFIPDDVITRYFRTTDKRQVEFYTNF